MRNEMPKNQVELDATLLLEDEKENLINNLASTGSKLTGPPAPFRLTLFCLGREVPNNKKMKRWRKPLLK